MSRILGIKEIAFDCQPSVFCSRGLEQPHRGTMLTSVFCVYICPSLQGLTGSQPSLAREMTEASSHSVQRLPALRSRCPWMSLGEFLYTIVSLPKYICVAVGPKFGGCVAWAQTAFPWLEGRRQACSLCAGILECSGTSQEFRQPYSSWLGLAPLFLRTPLLMWTMAECPQLLLRAWIWGAWFFGVARTCWFLNNSEAILGPLGPHDYVDHNIQGVLFCRLRPCAWSYICPMCGARTPLQT